MSELNPVKDRREFLRYNFEKPLKYSMLDMLKDRQFSAEFITALTNNLSASGIFFTTKSEKLPNISSLLIMDVDYRMANICKEIEEQALILNNKLVGRVIRIEDNEDGTYGIGVAFITNSTPLSRELRDIESLIKQS
jgi:hypothetical protein